MEALILRNARILTMRRDDAGRDEIIERGDVMVRDGRLVAVGRVDPATVPPDAREIDTTKLTVEEVLDEIERLVEARAEA